MKILIGVVAIAMIGTGIYTYKNHIERTTEVEDTEEVEKVQPVGPSFNADSAFTYCAAQCEFGPRTMNSEAHEKCADWIVAKFKQIGCEVKTQKADLQGFDGTTLKSTNIIASYNPKATTRILLCAHWDSRPWADNDPDSANHHKPVMAANDGASGIGVMIEIARQLQKDKKLKIGVDFVCFDAEDYGTPYWQIIRMTIPGLLVLNIGVRTYHKAMRHAMVFC